MLIGITSVGMIAYAATHNIEYAAITGFLGMNGAIVPDFDIAFSGEYVAKDYKKAMTLYLPANIILLIILGILKRKYGTNRAHRTYSHSLLGFTIWTLSNIIFSLLTAIGITYYVPSFDISKFINNQFLTNFANQLANILSISNNTLIDISTVFVLLLIFYIIPGALGYLSHLFADMCTKSGVPLLYPTNKKRYHLLPHPLLIKTGTVGETLFLIIYLLIWGSIVYLMTH